LYRIEKVPHTSIDTGLYHMYRIKTEVSGVGQQMEAQEESTLSADTLAAIRWLGMPEGTAFPLAVKGHASSHAEAQLEPQADDPEAWRKPFRTWVKSACVRHDGSSGGIGCMHIHFAEWAIANDAVPCTRATFELLLSEAGLLLCDGMVLDLILKIDYEAARLWRPMA
jgi:hypothetical protein